MRRLVARCDCGVVSVMPQGPTTTPDGIVVSGQYGICCQCGRKVSTKKAWWLNMESQIMPKRELDILAVV